MAIKVEHRVELFNNFNALKELFDYEFVEEEELTHLLEQLAENMYNYNLAKDYSPDYDHYHNHKLREQLNNERNKALSSLALHRGSFL